MKAEFLMEILESSNFIFMGFETLKIKKFIKILF